MRQHGEPFVANVRIVFVGLDSAATIDKTKVTIDNSDGARRRCR
jgi:hypothetical protein